MTTQLIIQVSTLSFALWLGLYLIGRNLSDTRLRLAGAGLVSYALGLALDVLALYAPEPAVAAGLLRWQQPFFWLPALCWFLLLVVLLRSDVPWRTGRRRQQRPVGVIMAATLFFTLGLTFLLFPLNWLPRLWVLLGIGTDLLFLGVAIAVLDAFDEGEALLPHFFRSFDTSFLTALLFGGQVVLVMVFSTGVTFPMLLLLLTTITAAILVQTFSDGFQTLLDRIAFLNFPQVRQTRAELRATATAVARKDKALDLTALDEEAFARLTRRALSHMGNLPRLAASPLTQLPLVEARLSRPNNEIETLARTAELKQILEESIARLKPRDKGDFGTTEEWRYYNALYFPYVVGLRPYSRRAATNGLDKTHRQALDWFRTQVPERTLYNWQNAAARLVAQDLREQVAANWH